MHCLLVGNYGVGNLGDEALCAYFLQAFPEVRWTVLSAHPRAGELPRLPGGVRSLLRPGWLRTVGALMRCDALVFGGGSLFTDVESSYACVLWGMHVLAARLLGKPVLLAFQGIGPFRTRFGEGIARRCAAVAVHISVRDSLSADRVHSWGLSSKCIQTSDPVFSLLEKKKISRNPKNVFIIIPRHNSQESFGIRAAELVLEQNTPVVHCVTMQPDSQEEQSVLKNISAHVAGCAATRNATTLDSLMESLHDASFVLTQRYHGALAALAMRIPMEIVPQGKGDKLSTLIGADPEALSRAVRTGEDALRSALERLSARS